VQKKQIEVQNTKRAPRFRRRNVPRNKGVAQIAREEKKDDKKIELAQKKKFGTQGKDPRSLATQKDVSFGFAMTSATSSIDYKPSVAANTVQGVLIPFFTGLCERGFFSATQDPSTPYFAYVYLFKSLTSAFQSTTPMVQRLPLGMKILFDAVSPVDKNFKAGQVSYTWNTEDSGFSVTPSYLFPLGSLSYNMGVPDGTNFVEGYPALKAPSTYTDPLGENAWTEVLAFLEALGKSYNNKLPMLEVVDANGTIRTQFKKDVSAFAACYAERGDSTTSPGNVGCISTELFSDTKITAPIFAKFAPYDQFNQSYSETHQFGGTVASLGARMNTFASESAVKNKFKLIMKPIDSFDIYSLLSFILASCIENSQAQDTLTPLSTCPLTPQDVYILLRTMFATYNTASWGMDYFIADKNNFRPYVFPFASAQMSELARNILMPEVLVENLRALTMTRMSAPPSFAGANAKPERTELIWVPVFGEWDDPNVDYYGNYQIGTTNLYSTVAVTPIRLLDGYVPSQSIFIQINGSQLDKTIVAWNNWINPFSTYTKLAKFSLEGSNAALNSLLYTRYVYSADTNPTLNTAKDKKTKLKEERNERLEKIIIPNRFSGALGSITPIENSGIVFNTVNVSGNQVFLDSLWNVIGSWVLPKVNFFNGTQECNGWAMAFYEPYQIRNASSLTSNFPSSQVNYPDLMNIYRSAASGIVKQQYGEIAEQWQLLYKVAEGGQGSVFTQTVADFAAMVTGIPAISTIGSIIGNFLPV